MLTNATLPAKVNQCVHSIIDEQNIGSNPAVTSWDGDLTYRELEYLTNKLAAKLVQLGIGPQVYVPLCFEKSMYNVISMIGVLKAGGAFVPLDHTHPQGRLKHFVEDVGAKLVLCSDLHRDKFEAIVEHVLVIDRNLIDGLSTLPESFRGFEASRVTPDDPAYIIFVSIFPYDILKIQENKYSTSLNRILKTSTIFTDRFS
jgi:non-ribosomal peptide synthetase component F